MNMWALLMIVLILLTILGVGYLANRIVKFSFIQKISKGKKKISILIGLSMAVVLTLVLWRLWGSMNAIICVLHLIIFWMVSDFNYETCRITPESQQVIYQESFP